MTNQNSDTIRKIQMLESNLSHIVEREQRIQQALEELKSARTQVSDTENPMRIIGNILVSQTKDELEEYITSNVEQKQKRLETVQKSKKKQLSDLKDTIVQ